MEAKMSAIRKQVEFYFSDSNYRRDTFLKAAAETDPEGFIPISVLLTFNKMKTLEATTDAIVEALGDSKVVTMNMDKTKLKKACPLSETDDSKARTVYAKGYPIDDPEVTIESVEQQFSVYGKINMVKFRRDDKKNFKGSCFIEYETEEMAKKAIAAANESNQINILYKGSPLLCVMPLLEWLDRKDAKHKRSRDNTHGSSNSNNKQVKSEDNQQSAELTATAENIPDFTPGLIIKLSNLSTNTTVDQLKDFFGTYGIIKYVDYESGDDHATIRVAEDATVKAIMTAINNTLKMSPDGPELKGDIMIGDEEIQYWKKIYERTLDRKRDRERGGRGGGRGRGGRGGGRGGKGGGRKRSRND